MKIEDLRKTPHWSYSALNTYLNVCQLQYYFRYIAQAETEQTSAALIFGKAFHSALTQQAAAAAAGESLTVEELTGLFQEYFSAGAESSANLKYKDGEDQDTMILTADRMFSAVLEMWSDFYNVQSFAEGFSVKIPSLDQPLIGEFDLIVDNGREACIVDWKSSASRWPTGKADRDLQATVFSYAYSKMYDKIPLFRFDVITKAKKPSCESHYTLRNTDDFDRFEVVASKIQKAISHGVFLPAETSYACGDCPYKSKCKDWKG